MCACASCVSHTATHGDAPLYNAEPLTAGTASSALYNAKPLTAGTAGSAQYNAKPLTAGTAGSAQYNAEPLTAGTAGSALYNAEPLTAGTAGSALYNAADRVQNSLTAGTGCSDRAPQYIGGWNSLTLIECNADMNANAETGKHQDGVRREDGK